MCCSATYFKTTFQSRIIQRTVKTLQHAVTLYHTATHINTLQRYLAFDCLQHRTPCRTVQLAAAHCNALRHQPTQCIVTLRSAAHSLSYTVAHCHTLQHTATNYHTNQHTAISPCARPDAPLLHCNTLQHTATHCNTLQHTATHTNTLQHYMRLVVCVGWRAVLPRSSAHWRYISWNPPSHCDTLQHTPTHCNTHRLTATHTDKLHLYLALSRLKHRGRLCNGATPHGIRHCDAQALSYLTSDFDLHPHVLESAATCLEGYDTFTYIYIYM